MGTLTRFCRQCMERVGLNPDDSKLKLSGCTSRRMVSCDGEEHKSAMITVDEAGNYLGSSTMPSVRGADDKWDTRNLIAGHSLSLPRKV